MLCPAPATVSVLGSEKQKACSKSCCPANTHSDNLIWFQVKCLFPLCMMSQNLSHNSISQHLCDYWSVPMPHASYRLGDSVHPGQRESGCCSDAGKSVVSCQNSFANVLYLCFCCKVVSLLVWIVLIWNICIRTIHIFVLCICYALSV